MKKLIMILFAVVAMQACTKDLRLIKQQDTKWELSEWPGKTLPTTAKATLNITSASKVGGRSFCNTYGGEAVINGHAIRFSRMFSTKMYCEAVSDAEVKYQTDLEKVTAGKISGNKLYLYRNETLLMVFSKL